MDYLTLGELLDELNCHNEEEELNVELTGEWGSYRGYYDQLFIGYSQGGKNYSNVKLLKNIIEEALNEGEMYGYKGGEFSVDDNTEVCFALDYSSVGGLYIKGLTKGFDGLKLEVEEEF